MLYEAGGSLGKVAYLLVAALAGGAALRGSRGAVRQEAARELAALGAPEGSFPEVGRVVVLEGTLVGASPGARAGDLAILTIRPALVSTKTRRAAPGKPPAEEMKVPGALGTSSRRDIVRTSGKLLLLVGHQRVNLPDVLSVASGSTQTPLLVDLPSVLLPRTTQRAVLGRLGARELVAGVELPAEGQLGTLRIGDRVRVRGRLEQQARSDEPWDSLAGDAPSSYRVPSARFLLAPERDGEPLSLVAAEPPRRVPVPLGTALLPALCAILALGALFFVLGKSAERPVDDDGTHLGTTALASMSPLGRKAALAQAILHLDLEHRADEARVQRGVRLAELAGDEQVASSILLEHGQIVALAGRSEAPPQQRGEALFLLGDFEAANSEFARGGVETFSSAAAALLVGDSFEARRVLGALARFDANADDLRCIASWLNSEATGPLAWMDDQPPRSWGCALLRYDPWKSPKGDGAAKDGPGAALARPTSGRPLDPGAHADELSSLQSLLMLERDPSHRDGIWVYADPREFLYDGSKIAFLRPVALERRMLGRSDLDPRVRVQLARSVAMFLSFMGDHEGARLALSPVVELLRGGGAGEAVLDYGGDAGLDDAVAIALRARDTGRAREVGVRPRLESDVRFFETGEAMHPFVTGISWTPNRRAWDAAARGDIATLEAQLRSSRDDGRAVFFAHGPRLASQGAPLRAWLAWGAPGPCVGCGLRAAAEWIAVRAEVAGALGDEKLARPLRAARTRHREAFLRRDVAVPLAVLEMVAQDHVHRR